MHEPVNIMGEEPYKPLENEGMNSTEEEETTAESTENEEEVVVTQESDEASNEELEKLKSENAQLKARLKKSKGRKEETRTDLETPDVPTSESVDERILKSQGMSDELIAELKRVARFQETDLISAQSDPMFVAIKERIEQEQKDKKAALGASKGSGSVAKKKDFATPNLTEDEHKAMWRKSVGH